jgi:5,10-methylenetetrahydrofolate reductase
MQYASQFDVKILAGIIVLASARMARYMNDNVPGIIVPQEIINELTGVEKGKGLQKGIEIAARLIRTIKEENLSHGVHTMAVGNERVVPDILEAAEVEVVHH